MNGTHESMTDPDARLYRKGPGQPAKLCFMGHAIEAKNRHGLVVAAAVSKATGTAERNAALAMIEARADRAKRITLVVRFRHLPPSAAPARANV